MRRPKKHDSYGFSNKNQYLKRAATVLFNRSAKPLFVELQHNKDSGLLLPSWLGGGNFVREEDEGKLFKDFMQGMIMNYNLEQFKDGFNDFLRAGFQIDEESIEDFNEQLSRLKKQTEIIRLSSDTAGKVYYMLFNKRTPTVYQAMITGETMYEGDYYGYDGTFQEVEKVINKINRIIKTSPALERALNGPEDGVFNDREVASIIRKCNEIRYMLTKGELIDHDAILGIPKLSDPLTDIEQVESWQNYKRAARQGAYDKKGHKKTLEFFDNA